MKKKFLFLYVGIWVLLVVLCASFVFLCINPNDPQYKMGVAEDKALSALKQKNIEEYFQYMDNPLVYKRDFSNMYFLSYHYATAGRYDDALRVIDEYTKNDYKKNYSICGIIDNLPKRFVCRLAIELFPVEPHIATDAEINHCKAEIYYQKGDYKKAIELVNESDDKYICDLSKYYAADGQVQKAEQLVALCQRPTAVNYTYGLIYMSQKNYPKAEEYFNRSYKNNAITLELAELYKRWGKKELSQKYARQKLQYQPWNAKAWSYLKNQLLQKTAF